jgi:hypothetical protein
MFGRNRHVLSQLNLDDREFYVFKPSSNFHRWSDQDIYHKGNRFSFEFHRCYFLSTLHDFLSVIVGENEVLVKESHWNEKTECIGHYDLSDFYGVNDANDGIE